MKKTISIMGCGWFGLPLALQLKQLGFEIKGSTTTNSKLVTLINNGIEPYLINLDDKNSLKKNLTFFDSNILLINIPPARIENIESHYFQMIESLVSIIGSSNTNIIFISSTSVYGEHDLTNEGFDIKPDKPSGLALLKVEKMLYANFSQKLLILRFAGLIGADRHPGRFLAEKRQLKDGNAPVNLIHLSDCIAITCRLIQNKILNGIYNVCCDDHPKRRDFYVAAAKKGGYTLPEFIDEQQIQTYKIVSNQKLKMILGDEFKLIYPSPLDAI